LRGCRKRHERTTKQGAAQREKRTEGGFHGSISGLYWCVWGHCNIINPSALLLGSEGKKAWSAFGMGMFVRHFDGPRGGFILPFFPCLGSDCS
jgi:hypothetical protein